MNKVPEALKHFNYEINASSRDVRQSEARPIGALYKSGVYVQPIHSKVTLIC